MSNRQSLLTIAPLVVALFTVAPAPAPAAPAPDPSGTWEAEGVMSDGCQCEVFCPCEFLSKPTFNHCDDAAVLHVTKGHFGKVKLDGKSVAVVSQSREGKRLVDTVGDLQFARIYVPEEATDEQTKALAEIARRVFGAFVGETARISPDEMVKKVKIDFEVRPHYARAHIPGILEIEMESVMGGDGKTPIVLKNSPFSAAGFGDVEVAMNKVYRYTEGKIDWNYPGRSASIRPFKMSGNVDDKGAAPAAPAGAALEAPAAPHAGASKEPSAQVAVHEARACCSRRR